MKQQNALVRYLWNCGVEAKKWRMENGLDNTHWFYDPLIFEKVRSSDPLRRVGAPDERTGPRARDHQRQRAALQGRAVLPPLLPEGRHRRGLRRHGDRGAVHAAGGRRLHDRERGRPAALLRLQAGGRPRDGLPDVGPGAQRNPVQGPRRSWRLSTEDRRSSRRSSCSETRCRAISSP